MASSAGPSTHQRSSMLSPYHTIPGSALPCPVSSSGNKPPDLSRKTKAPRQVEDEELKSDANGDAGAMSMPHAIDPSADAHARTTDVTEVNVRLTSANPGDNQNTAGAIASHPTNEAIKPSRTRPATAAKLRHWIHTLPSTTPQPMTTLPSSPQPVQKASLDDPDAKTPAVPVVSGPNDRRNIATVDEMFVGSTTRGIAEQEVEEARAQSGEMTAARQQVALTKGKKGRIRGLFERMWGKIKGHGNARPDASS